MILVTGSSGFVGTHLISELIKRKYEICCLLRPSAGHKFVEYLKKNNVKIAFGELTDYTSLDKALNKVKISKVVHLAGIIKSGSKRAYELSNVKSTLNLAKICKNKKAKKIVFISSDVVAEKELTYYGESKYKAELIIKKSRVPYSILRPTVIYGKGDNKFIMELARRIRAFPVVPVVGNGEYIFQPVFIDDIIRLIVKCMEIKNNGTYIVCSDEALTLNNIIDEISRALNKKVYKLHIPLFLLKPVVQIYERISPNPSITSQQLDYFPKRVKIDNSSAKKELNFEFTSFKDGIIKSV